MDIGNVAGVLARQLGLAAEIRRRGRADRGIEPVVQRHAGAARGGLGPLADGWIDALCTPRYARIHAFVRFEIRWRMLRRQPSRASLTRDNPIRRRSSASGIDLFVLR